MSLVAATVVTSVTGQNMRRLSGSILAGKEIEQRVPTVEHRGIREQLRQSA
jgi:hypothetical protein